MAINRFVYILRPPNGNVGSQFPVILAPYFPPASSTVLIGLLLIVILLEATINKLQ